MTAAAGPANAPGAVNWELAGESVVPGWLPIPVRESTDAAAWTAAQTDELRRAWGHAWQPVFDDVVPAMLDAALDHRRPEDVFAFQIWPTDAPVCIFVHAAAGPVAPGTPLPGPGDGVLYEAEGLGPGIQVPIIETVAGRQVVGLEFIFLGADLAVTAYVEPTLPEILSILMPSVHAFVQSLTLTGSDGSRFRADPPPLLEAGPDASWVDSLTAP